MSYTSENITVLKNRIGFGEKSEPSVPTIEDEIKIGTSERTFRAFHDLATVDNVFFSTKLEMNEADFNDHLDDIRLQAVKLVLNRIFDTNKEYDSSEDFSELITERPEIFENSIGYAVATKVIEQCISSERLNKEKRNTEMSYEKLKIELEGAFTSEGARISKGIKGEMNLAIERAIEVIFDPKPHVNSQKVW